MKLDLTSSTSGLWTDECLYSVLQYPFPGLKHSFQVPLLWFSFCLFSLNFGKAGWPNARSMNVMTFISDRGLTSPCSHFMVSFSFLFIWKPGIYKSTLTSSPNWWDILWKSWLNAQKCVSVKDTKKIKAVSENLVLLPSCHVTSFCELLISSFDFVSKC